MDDCSDVREGFPQTGKLSAPGKRHRIRELHHQSVCRARSWAPYLEELTRAKVFELTGEIYDLRYFSSRHMGTFFMTPRKWAWWILHHHAGLEVAWTVIAERYSRHRTSVMYTTRAFDAQIRRGHWREDVIAMQDICEKLSQIGLQGFNIFDHLAE